MSDLPVPSPAERVHAIIAATAAVMDVPVQFLLMPTRGVHRIAFARHVAMYVAGSTVALPHADIAAEFKRARTSISVAMRSIGGQLIYDGKLREQVLAIQNRAHLSPCAEGAEGAPKVEADS